MLQQLLPGLLTVVQSVAGDHLEAHTTNGAITGQFKTTADLDLHSTNGYVPPFPLLPSLRPPPILTLTLSAPLPPQTYRR